MPKNKPVKIKPAQLRDAFKTDLATCWQHARALHPDHTPYAFVLQGLEGTPQLYPNLLTEEGLTQVAKRYIANGHYETLDEARKELRYSVEDSPFGTELDGKFSTVDSLVEPTAHTLDETAGYALLAKAAIEAFAALDKQEIFGKGKQREQLLLMIDTSFAEKDWSLPSVKRLNPKSAVKRYEAQTKVEGVYASCDAMTFSPDGRRLYFAGQREVDARREKSEWEVVGCDVAGLQLKRRWHKFFPALEGFRGIAIDPDGASVLAIADCSVRGNDKTRLMKFNADSGKQIQELTLDGSAQSLAASTSGLVVATGDEMLHVLSPNFKPLQIAKLRSYPFAALTLKSGDTFVGCEKDLARVDSSSKFTSIPFKNGVFWLSADNAERVLLVSRSFNFLGSRLERDAEFGFQVFALPKLKLQRTISIPGCQLVRAVVSPDGKLIACSASVVGKGQYFVVVFETRKFREVARRPSNHSPALRFSPDSRFLAFTKDGYTTSEPIVLWRLPLS